MKRQSNNLRNSWSRRDVIRGMAGLGATAFARPIARALPSAGGGASSFVPARLADYHGLRTFDLSQDTARQVVVAAGTESVYQGHPTTLLLKDQHTIYCVWTIGHGGPCGPMKKSVDGGRHWSALLPVPEDWKKVRNCPTIYRLPAPDGRTRDFVFAGNGPDGCMYQAHSEDECRTWTSMTSNHLPECVMPFCSIVPIDNEKRLLGMTNIRRPGEKVERRSNVLAQSISEDGGLTWSPFRIVLDLPGLKPCEPAVLRAPAGGELLCLIRENVKRVALYMKSRDEGKTWSKAMPLPPGLWGDRHMPRYAPDGRLVVTFRDTGADSPTKNNFVAWVGHYGDIALGRDGQYRVKLLQSYRGGDCGYSGLEVLPDATFVATTYIKYHPGPDKNSVVSVRFKLSEIDSVLRRT